MNSVHYEQGVYDRSIGKDDSHCPHGNLTSEGKSWLDGWRDMDCAINENEGDEERAIEKMIGW